MDMSQIAARHYFSRGEWQEKLEHDAEKRHYADGGTIANWPGYDKLIERESLSRPGFKAPKKEGRGLDFSHRFVSHRLRDYRLMVSPLITIGSIRIVPCRNGLGTEPIEKAHARRLDIERDRC